MEVKDRYSYSTKRVRKYAETTHTSSASFIIKGFYRTMCEGSVVDTPFMCYMDEIPEWLASTGSLLVYDDIKNDLESGKLICDQPPGCNGLFFFRREPIEFADKA